MRAVICLIALSIASCDSASSDVEVADKSIRFIDAPGNGGIDFRHAPWRSAERYAPEIIGSGVVVTDFNRDGAPDIYLIGGGDLTSGTRPESSRDRLYLNDGKGNFRDVTREWSVPSSGYGMGAAAGDYDGDGWTDLYLTGFGHTERLLRNTGAGFEDVTAAAGLIPDERWSTSAAFFDADGDGDLDLYVAYYIDYSLEDAIKCWHNGRHIYCSPTLYDPSTDKLLMNQGDGSFVDASDVSGVSAQPGFGLALVTGDVDRDGDVDVYVANDTSNNFLLINDGKGHFVDRGRIAGVAYDETGRESAGMGTDFSDIDGDGLIDIACTNFQGETTNLYRQVWPMVFRDRSYVAGIGKSASRTLGFGLDFFDFDNDGFEDLLVANGHVDDGIESVSETVSFGQQNLIYRNLGDGRFEDVTDRAGAPFQRRDVSRGIASADLDGDRLLDFVVTNNAGPARIVFNRSVPAGDAVLLWLEGRPPNTSAIGARVEARIGSLEFSREVRGGSSFLSICDFRVHLGLAGHDHIDELVVIWPDGERQSFKGVRAGTLRLVQGGLLDLYEPGAVQF